MSKLAAWLMGLGAAAPALAMPENLTKVKIQTKVKAGPSIVNMQ